MLKTFFVTTISCVVAFGSSAALGQTFVCNNWSGGIMSDENGVFPGTIFIGTHEDDVLTISNAYKKQIVLTYIGDFNSTGVSLFQGVNSTNHVSIYAKTRSADYDFSIVQLAVNKDDQKQTDCNYQK